MWILTDPYWHTDAAGDGCIIRAIFDTLGDVQRKLTLWRFDYKASGCIRVWETPIRSERAERLGNLRPPRPARLPRTAAQTTNLKFAKAGCDLGANGGRSRTFDRQIDEI